MSKIKANGKLTHPLMVKAIALAEVDHKVNGGFHNSPYNVCDADGVNHKAHVRFSSEQGGERVYVEIVRPAQIVTTGVLWERPADVTERVPEEVMDKLDRGENTPW